MSSVVALWSLSTCVAGVLGCAGLLVSGAVGSFLVDSIELQEMSTPLTLA